MTNILKAMTPSKTCFNKWMKTNAEHNSPQHLVNFILFNNHIISSGFPSIINALFPTQHIPLPVPVVSTENTSCSGSSSKIVRWLHSHEHLFLICTNDFLLRTNTLSEPIIFVDHTRVTALMLLVQCHTICNRDQIP